MDQSLSARRPVRWFIAAAALCTLSVATLTIAGHRNNAWIVSTIAHHCRYPAPLPDNRILGVATVVAIIAAFLCLVAGVWFALGSSRRWWLKAAALAAIIIAAPAAALILLMGVMNSEEPGPPSHGTDGSGLPCPFESYAQ